MEDDVWTEIGLIDGKPVATLRTQYDVTPEGVAVLWDNGAISTVVSREFIEHYAEVFAHLKSQ